jgi:hypothetical protein
LPLGEAWLYYASGQVKAKFEGPRGPSVTPQNGTPRREKEAP